jgi:hypothetical protein
MLIYRLLADMVLIAHLLIVLFVTGGLLLVVAGNLRGWNWVNLLWFRLAHLATIAIVAGEAWLGIECPLTTLEMWLRIRAHATTYAGGFIEHWLHALLFWEAPPWAFAAAYTAFGVAVAAAWWYFPPHRSQHRRGKRDRALPVAARRPR